MNDKPKVMCDTMIWYDLHFGEETLDKTNFDYYGSVSNIADFLSSDKMRIGGIEEEKLKNAIISMNENSSDILMLDPTSVGSSFWFNIELKQEEAKNIRADYKELLKYAYGEVNSIVGRPIMSLIETKEKFRLGSVSTKRQLEKLFNEGGHSVEQQHEVIIGNILRWLLTEWNRMNGTNFTEEEVADWESISIFVNTYAEFLKTVVVDEPPNKNTMIDLLQLLYIRTNGSTLIWTKEPKIINKIKEAMPEDQWKNIIYQEHIKKTSLK